MTTDNQIPPTCFKRITRYIASLFFFLFFLAAFTWYIVRVASFGEVLFMILAVLLSGIGIFLAERFPVLRRAISASVAAYFRFSIGMFITLGPLTLFYWFSLFILERLNLIAQIIVLILWGSVLAWALGLIFTESRRIRLLARLKKIGSLTPLAYSINLLAVAAFFFSAITYLFAVHGLVTLKRANAGPVLPGNISDFYFWHFFAAVPILKVNETLRWAEPLTYEGSLVGWLLLLFKATVIVPMIAAFTWYWKEVATRSDQGVIASAGAGGVRFMRVVIAGGSGQLGQILARAFHQRGDEVVILSRTVTSAPWRVVQWDAETVGDWASELEDADVVINLAGRSVDCRYNKKNRKLITQSRVDSTRIIGKAITSTKRPPRVWLQVSTATIYSHTYERDNNEGGEIGCSPDVPDTWKFSFDVVREWEDAMSEPLPATRKVLLRTAMVMSPDRDGVFDKLLKLIRFRLGGRAGDGRQYVSWIHDQDFVRSIYWLILHDEISGPVNICSPNPLPNKDFMKILRDAYGVGFGLSATRLMLEIGALVMKTETELILKSRRVVPGRLLESGFEFQFPSWDLAATDLCTRWRDAR